MGIFHHTREWIYQTRVEGTYQRLHRISGVLLIGVMLVLPWVRVGKHPALLADIPARRFYFFGDVFTASDGFLMVLGALSAAFALFLASALFGRLWCGYFCPQTVFMEEWVRRVELWFEGDARKRMDRDAGPRTFDWAWRKVGKIATLQALSLVLGLTLVSYFADARVLWMGHGSSTAYLMVGIVSASAMLDWLWFREQLCIYLCPYARLQSALTDDYSLMVAYDASVPVGQGKQAIEDGSCIDCKRCAAVCPQGIDIRDGYQLECINCARCVDACTDVLGKFGRPSLVTYTTTALQEGRPQRAVRTRVLVYSAVVAGLMLALTGLVVLHNPMEVSLNRAPGTLYQLEDDGRVRNTYLLRVVNNAQGDSRTFHLALYGIDAELDTPELILEPEESRTVPVVIRAWIDGLAPTVPIRVTIEGGRRIETLEATFRSPGGEG